MILLICSFISCNKTKEVEPIRISINAWPGYAYAFVAKEKGFFNKNNVSVELNFKKNINESRALYANGKVDGLFDVFTDIIMINARGIHTKIVYITDYSNEGDVIIGRKDLHSLRDVRDKVVSFDGFNSFSHLFVLQSIINTGLSETDVHFGNIHAMDVLTALENGEIDAGHTWEPVTTQALAKGYKILTMAGDMPGIITDVLAFNTRVIETRPKDVEKIIKSLIEARDYLYTNREESIKIMAHEEGMSFDEMQRGINEVVILNLTENIKAMQPSNSAISLHRSGETIIDFFQQRGQLTNRLSLDTIIEPMFIKSLKE
ncbi:MAG: ABC transporter substrate-binding protein [Nitrospirota bacterium]